MLSVADSEWVRKAQMQNLCILKGPNYAVKMGNIVSLNRLMYIAACMKSVTNVMN